MLSAKLRGPRPWVGAGIAIAITASMDATGLSMFSALPLLGLTALFWLLGRYSRREMGFVVGTREGYGWALAYPLAVPGLLAAVAFAVGAVDVSDADWSVAASQALLVASVGVLGTLLTEEGFFRGWLWAAFSRAGRGEDAVLILTSAIFSLWHLSAVVLDTGFAPPPKQVPVFMINAGLLGLNWGLMRRLSGSVLAPAVSHAVWNALVYGLFGFGEKTGELGITQSTILGPEVGWLGLLGNGLFALLIWRRIRACTSP